MRAKGWWVSALEPLKADVAAFWAISHILVSDSAAAGARILAVARKTKAWFLQ